MLYKNWKVLFLFTKTDMQAVSLSKCGRIPDYHRLCFKNHSTQLNEANTVLQKTIDKIQEYLLT